VSRFVPRYFEIEQALRTRIAKLPPHSSLPSDANLCAEFGVSRMTARGAVQRLVQEGLVYRVPGRGTFVAEAAAHRSATHILSFSDEMRRRGRVPSSRIVRNKIRTANDEERERLGADRVVVLRRVRIADDEPIALETAVFPAERVEELLEGDDLERVSLHETLARGNVVPTAGRAAVAAEAATAEDARLLEIRKGDPLLVERRLIRDQDGEPLEWTETRYVGSRYGLDVTFDVELPP
jgi:DNA-binding GntR family transcriptional regulator